MKKVLIPLTASAVIAVAAKVQGSLPMAIGAAGVYLVALGMYISRKQEIEAAEFNQQIEREDMLTRQDDFAQTLEREKLFRWYERYSA